MHWGSCAERLQQLDLGVRQFDEDYRDPVRGQRARLRDPGAEDPLIELACGRQIGHDNRNMVQPSDHRPHSR